MAITPKPARLSAGSKSKKSVPEEVRIASSAETFGDDEASAASSRFWRPRTVPAREFQNRPGQYLDMALQEPLTITKNGRPRNVVMSVEEFERLKRRDRQVVGLKNISPEDAAEFLAALKAARIPEEAEAFDDEYPEVK